MANEDHVKILKQGPRVWNQWRAENPEIKPDLSGAHIGKLQLDYANLIEANLDEAYLGGILLLGAFLNKATLRKANLRHSTLDVSDFTEADLTEAHLNYCRAHDTKFIKANLSDAHFDYARLESTNFDQATLVRADLTVSYLHGCNFRKANLSKARVGWATFSDIDLSVVKGLLSTVHAGPSTIGIDTLYRSGGKIPEKFLRNCGVPEELITYVPDLIGAQQAIQFYSCFISYSHKDEEFAKQLHSRMQDAQIRVWYASKDIKGGRKLHEQIFNAIQIHDKLLLVLSKHSLQSEWVMTEIRKARKIERDEKRRKLFPIRLVDFEAIQKWECFDADSGKDLAVEMREYFIPDFTNWKDQNSFEKSFDKLLHALKAEEVVEH